MLTHTVGIAHAGIAGLLVLSRYAMGRIPFRRASIESIGLLCMLLLYGLLFATGIVESGKRLGYTDIGITYVADNLFGLTEFLFRYMPHCCVIIAY